MHDDTRVPALPTRGPLRAAIISGGIIGPAQTENNWVTFSFIWRCVLRCLREREREREKDR